MIGEKNPMFGKIGINKNKKFSIETKNKISKSLKGKCGLRGNKNPMFGKVPHNKGTFLTEELKMEMSKKAKEKWKNTNPEEKEKRLKQLKEVRENFLKTKKETKQERIVREILERKEINFEPQKEIGCYLCDFIINNKIVLEIQGDYWHANPFFYNKNELDLIQKKNIKRDENKKIFLEKLGYSVFYFWERDILKNVKKIEEKLEQIK